MTRYAPLWQQAGSYSASLDRDLIGALWPTGGCVGGVASAVNNTTNVSVAAGQCAVPTQTGDSALCTWDAAEVVDVTKGGANPLPGSGLSRIDLIICQLRDNALDGGANNDFIVTSVPGTAAASPVAPATPTNAYVLARVLIPGAVANLNTATLTDYRSAPLASGVGPSFVAHLAAAQSVPNNASTLLAFDTVDRDPYNGWSMSQRGYVVPPGSGGLWLVNVSLAWAANATGVRGVFMFAGANQVGWQFTPANADNGNLGRMTASALQVVAAGTVLTANGFQSSGAALTTNTTFQTSISGVRLGL